jgi:hypothetical protein
VVLSCVVVGALVAGDGGASVLLLCHSAITIISTFITGNVLILPLGAHRRGLLRSNAPPGGGMNLSASGYWLRLGRARPPFVATNITRHHLTNEPGGTTPILRGKLFRQPEPALLIGSFDFLSITLGRACCGQISKSLTIDALVTERVETSSRSAAADCVTATFCKFAEGSTSVRSPSLAVRPLRLAVALRLRRGDQKIKLLVDEKFQMRQSKRYCLEAGRMRGGAFKISNISTSTHTSVSI